MYSLVWLFDKPYTSICYLMFRNMEAGYCTVLVLKVFVRYSGFGSSPNQSSGILYQCSGALANNFKTRTKPVDQSKDPRMHWCLELWSWELPRRYWQCFKPPDPHWQYLCASRTIARDLQGTVCHWEYNCPSSFQASAFNSCTVFLLCQNNTK